MPTPDRLPAIADAHLRALLELLAHAGVPLTISHAGSLAEVVAAHPGDRSRSLGVVVLAADAPPATRVAAAYYMRPVERDAGGHLQRRPPALLAAWDAAAARFDHFDWAVTDELAARVAMTRADFESEIRQREAQLARVSQGASLHRDANSP